MIRTLIVVSARMASSRCPGKALAPLAGRPLLQVLLERMAAAPEIDPAGWRLRDGVRPQARVVHARRPQQRVGGDSVGQGDRYTGRGHAQRALPRQPGRSQHQ